MDLTLNPKSIDDPPPAPAKARSSDPPESHEAAEAINAAVEASGQDKNKPSKELLKVFLRAMRLSEPATARCVEAWMAAVPNEFKMKFSVERIRAAKKWCADNGFIVKVGTSKAGGVWKLTEKGRG